MAIQFLHFQIDPRKSQLDVKLSLQPLLPDGGHGLDAEEEGAGEGGHVVHAVHVVRRLVRGQVPVRQRHQEPDAGEQQPRDVEGGAETVSHYQVINTV